MNYNEAISYIEGRLRFGIKPGLSRTQALLDALGEPQRRLRFIHVAGTNGKGSVSNMIASVMHKSGCKTGLFTSPYITDFRERMQIDFDVIPRERLAQLTERVKNVIDCMDDRDQVTEFELITCIALLWFCEERCDVVVLEVGLGGRLDSTNVIEHPLCSIITRIDLDHTAILGDTVEQIAGEKCGIIKQGCPVVLSPVQPEGVEDVVRQCADNMGSMLSVPDMSSAEVTESTMHGSMMRVDEVELFVPLMGEHQTVNALTAVTALKVIAEREPCLGVNDRTISQGMEAVTMPARQELVSTEPLVMIDGAHNPNGATALRRTLDRYFGGYRIYTVMGVLRDKDYSAELEILRPMDEIFCCDGFSDRCLSAEELARLAGGYAAAGSCDTPEEAFERALVRVTEKTRNGERALLLICGSLYLAGRLRPYIINKMQG